MNSDAAVPTISVAIHCATRLAYPAETSVFGYR